MKVLLVDDYSRYDRSARGRRPLDGHAVSQAYSGVEALVVSTGEGPFDVNSPGHCAARH